jgi:putative ABC transport system substrate-binding protein
MIKRREFITLVGGAAAWPVAASAQSPQTPRSIGILMGLSEDDEGRDRLKVFRQALERLGWTENRNLHITYRWASADPTQALVFAKELADLKPDLFFAHSTPVTIALKEVAGSTPIVFIQVSDPVVSRVVESLPRPRGNITGFTNYEPAMTGKWLEILKTLAPGMVRVVYLFNSTTTPAFYRSWVEDAAQALSLKSIAAEVRTPDEISHSIKVLAGEPNGGLLVMPDVFTSTNSHQIIALAAAYRQPALYTFRFFAMQGGLLSYGIDVLDVYERAASYVDRVLRGANPGELPVQAPTKFELVINLKTANALGFEIPPTLLARADEVIE